MTQAAAKTGRLALQRAAGLYVIVDVDASEARQLDWFRVAQSALLGGASLLQFRAKGRTDTFVLESLVRLRALVRRGEGAFLFANDRPDLAAMADADGVHLGQEDLPAALVRQHYPELLLGLSTHDPAQFRAALELDLAYVALGPVFATSSKKNPEPVVGARVLALLGQEARARGLPVVAIGGLGLPQIPEVASHAAWVAVISAVLPRASSVGAPYEEIERRTRQFAQLLAEAQTLG